MQNMRGADGMSAVKKTVYIKGDESVEVTSQTVNLGDLVELECSDRGFCPDLGQSMC